MKALLTLTLVLLVGCQSLPTPSANISHPARPLVTTPYVEFMGDDQIQGLVTYANNPRWKCTTCVPRQTSTQLIPEVSQVAALKPDIVYILTGAYDLIDNPYNTHDEPTVGNVETMLNAFETAKIPAVVCLMPPSTAYDPWYFNEAVDALVTSGVITYELDFNIDNPDSTSNPIPVTTGVDFNSFGLSKIYPLTYQSVESFHLGGEK